MKRLSNLAFSTLLVLGLSACSGAVEQSAEADLDVQGISKPTQPYATVKPGASVTLNPVLPKSMTSGSFQTVQLRLNESYSSGPLSVTVEASNGLSLFGGASTKIFDMEDIGEHVWDIDVKSDEDGIYFLNVFVEAGGRARSFSVRLQMGQITQKMSADALQSDGELTDGGQIRVLDATETIK